MYSVRSTWSLFFSTSDWYVLSTARYYLLIFLFFWRNKKNTATTTATTCHTRVCPLLLLHVCCRVDRSIASWRQAHSPAKRTTVRNKTYDAHHPSSIINAILYFEYVFTDGAACSMYLSKSFSGEAYKQQAVLYYNTLPLLPAKQLAAVQLHYPAPKCRSNEPPLSFLLPDKIGTTTSSSKCKCCYFTFWPCIHVRYSSLSPTKKISMYILSTRV